jgi:hypothetical protein
VSNDDLDKTRSQTAHVRALACSTATAAFEIERLVGAVQGLVRGERR